MKVGAICDEENDICLDEPDDSLCENGLFCDGAEFCDPTSGQCQPGLTCPAAIDGPSGCPLRRPGYLGIEVLYGF